MDTMVDYTNTILDSFRSDVFDAIMIYGFTVGNAATGVVKAKMKILDGLRFISISDIKKLNIHKIL